MRGGGGLRGGLKTAGRHRQRCNTGVASRAKRGKRGGDRACATVMTSWGKCDTLLMIPKTQSIQLPVLSLNVRGRGGLASIWEPPSPERTLERPTSTMPAMHAEIPL